MDINNSILSFGDYFLLTLKTSKKKFCNYYSSFYLYGSNYNNNTSMFYSNWICNIALYAYDLFQNSDAMQSYLTSDTYIYQILALLPILFIAYIVFVFFNMLFFMHRTFCDLYYNRFVYQE